MFNVDSIEIPWRKWGDNLYKAPVTPSYEADMFDGLYPNYKGCPLYLPNVSFAGQTYKDLSFESAFMPKAKLMRAEMIHCLFRYTTMFKSDMSYGSFEHSSFYGANLAGCDLQGCDLSNTNLRKANLFHAKMDKDTNLEGAKLPNFQVIPEVGEFTGYKKVQDEVVTLRIPADALRTCCLTSRKCRVEYAIVESISNNKRRVITRTRGANKAYVVGRTVRADSFNGDIRLECTNGLHLFPTYQEAEDFTITRRG